MKKAFAVIAALALLCLGTLAQAQITIATVPVGNAGNAPDPATGSGYGEVDYNYNIGEYDVTDGQYTAFLNAVAATDTYGCYNYCGITQSGASGSYSYSATDASLPVASVSFWDACRFANWLNNGQPTGAEGIGTTETGAYTLTACDMEDNYTITPITRNAGATWAVTSENEWYKAAYYDPALNGGAGGYYEYATQSNTAPTACGPTSAANSANYNNAVGHTTNVGAYTGSASYYGTYDQNGNLWEWNESIIDTPFYRGARGGSFGDPYYLGDEYGLSSATRNDYTEDHFPNYADGGSGYIGFRVVNLVPEPSSIIALLGGLVGLLGIRRRRA